MRIRLAFSLISAGAAAILGGVLLAACAPDTTAPTLQRLPSATPDAGAGVEVAALAPSEAPTRLAPFTDQACLDCHTNRPQLETLAVGRETTESHSEGPG